MFRPKTSFYIIRKQGIVNPRYETANFVSINTSCQINVVFFLFKTAKYLVVHFELYKEISFLGHTTGDGRICQLKRNCETVSKFQNQQIS